MSTTKIQWTDRVWNPIRGCSRTSPGCERCYAERHAARFADPGLPFHGFAKRTPHGPAWTRRVELVPDKLAEPLGWQKPARVFVNSMSDLFHEELSNEDIAAVFGVMAAAPQHTFQVLTKRAKRMREWFEWLKRERERFASLSPERTADLCTAATVERLGVGKRTAVLLRASLNAPWPLPNVWLGVSVEDQERADERIPELLRTPAAVRFLSCEPLLGPVTLRHAEVGDSPETIPTKPVANAAEWDDWKYWAARDRGIHWVIVGGESGPGARPFERRWATSLVEQCKAAGVAVFVKQLGAFVVDRNDAGFDGMDLEHWPDGDCWDMAGDYDRVEDNIHGFREEYQGAPVRVRLLDKKGGDPSEWPVHLRVREFPKENSNG